MTGLGNPFGAGRGRGIAAGHAGHGAAADAGAAGPRPSGFATPWPVKGSGANRRRAVLGSNKYQRQIITLALVPSVIFCLVMYFLLEVFQHDAAQAIIDRSDAVSVVFLTEWGIVLVLTVLLYSGSVFLWAYAVSNQMVGAFERIIRELDRIIEGGAKGPITARGRDELANSLLKRINVLIENVPGSGRLSQRSDKEVTR